MRKGYMGGGGGLPSFGNLRKNDPSTVILDNRQFFLKRQAVQLYRIGQDSIIQLYFPLLSLSLSSSPFILYDTPEQADNRDSILRSIDFFVSISMVGLFCTSNGHTECNIKQRLRYVKQWNPKCKVCYSNNPCFVA